MSDAELDALDREIAEALEPRPVGLSGQSPLRCWWNSLGRWRPNLFSRDLNACVVMRARLRELGAEVRFMQVLRLQIFQDDLHCFYDVLYATAEQQALAAREVLRGIGGASEPLVAHRRFRGSARQRADCDHRSRRTPFLEVDEWKFSNGTSWVHARVRYPQ